MFLVLLPLRNLPGFQELCVRNWGHEPTGVFSVSHNLKLKALVDGLSSRMEMTEESGNLKLSRYKLSNLKKEQKILKSGDGVKIKDLWDNISKFNFYVIGILGDG